MSWTYFNFLLLLVPFAFVVSQYGQCNASEAVADDESSKSNESSDEDSDSNEVYSDESVSSEVTEGAQPCEITDILLKLGVVCPEIRDSAIKELEMKTQSIADGIMGIKDLILNHHIDSQELKLKPSMLFTNRLSNPAIADASLFPQHLELLDVLIAEEENLTDCADAFAKDYKKPGVYLVHPVGSAYKVRALCIDGWSILQRRFDGSEDFHRKFDDYIAGFGNFSGEFFLGLENIHLLTQSEPYTLRIDVKGTTGKWYFAIYENFQLAGELDDYRLKLGNMIAGNYVDTLENSRDQKFSALDRDNDGWKGGNCAEHYRGGWWSNQCITNLNTMWCRSGCLQWGDKLIIDSLIRIRPSASLDPDDMTETLNPVGFSTDG